MLLGMIVLPKFDRFDVFEPLLSLNLGKGFQGIWKRLPRIPDHLNLLVLLKNVILLQNLKKMLQRIQTLYLVISAALIGLLFALPFAEIAHNEQFFLFDIRGIVRNDVVEENGLAIAAFIGIILLLHVVVINLYKKRILQIRLLVFTILLLIGLFGMFYFFTYYAFDDAQISFKLPVVFPLVAIILDYLAIRNIGKDEALIRSIDRIR